MHLRLSFAVLLLTFTILGFAAAAQDFGAPAQSTYVEVRPLSRTNPDYPRGPLATGKEGWVALSFVVTAAGNVAEPMVEQSSGGEPFELAALRAVEQWKYEPATQDGVPVEAAQSTTIRFQLEGGGGGAGFGRGDYVERASPAFVKNYQQLVRLVDGQDFEGAGVLLAAMEADQRMNRYETAWLWWAKYVYLSRASSSDLAQMRRALERAVGSEDDMYLSTDQFVAAAERLVVLHAQSLDIAAAIAMFERLRETVAKVVPTSTAARASAFTQAVASLQPSYEAMNALVASDQLMAMNGSVGEFDYWVHDLLRRSFSFADIEGRLEVLDIRCERARRRIDEIAAGIVWRVPEEWGACGIYVKGEPGATFALREYPHSFTSPSVVDVATR